MAAIYRRDFIRVAGGGVLAGEPARARSISPHVDRGRLLPMTDPWYRQSMVSQGTFIESPVLALHCSPNGALGRNAFPSRAVLALHRCPGRRRDAENC